MFPLLTGEAATGENGARTVTHTADVQHAYAVVHVVANPIIVEVRGAVSTADAEGVQLVALAVASPQGEGGATAQVNRTGTIAYPAFVISANAAVDIVALSIAIEITGAGATAYT